MRDHAGAEFVAERLETIRARVAGAAEAAGRDPGTIGIVAVTKGHAVDAVEIATSLGLLDIGESRVQEAEVKMSTSSGGGVAWHMIGHLQRNKARAAAALFDVVQSVDSAALASAVSRHRAGAATPLRVFIEVELTGIPGRAGVTPEQTRALVDHVRTLDDLKLAGLMTIAPPGPPEAAAACFAQLSALRDTVNDRDGAAVEGLSMGMSDDFEIAIAHGATIIRLGRALFGDPERAGR